MDGGTAPGLRSRWRRMLIIVLAVVVGLYLLVCAAAWALQDRLLFPAFAVPAPDPLPDGVERLVVTRPDGVHLHGVRFPARGGGGEGTLMLVFVGNGTDAQGLAGRLAGALPGIDIVTFNYRGYAPSEGSPSAQALIEDAVALDDEVQARYRPRRLVLYGQSIGSGVAAALAVQRPPAGLILVTPFDSLRAVVSDNYPWLPVGLLFRHEIESAALLAGRPIPSAIIAGSADTLVRPERTAALRPALADLRHDRVLDGAGHNGITRDPRFAEALREAVAALAQH